MRPRTLLFLLLAGCPLAAASAATPPALVNYQGVLRDAAGAPLSGTYDMTFRFFDVPVSGREILIDAHQAATMNPVVVSGGAFSTQLGAGTVTDGSGPGTYTSLAEVFRDYAAVWMEISIGAETLAPRVRVTASAYALNASNFEGRPASGFLDTSATPQTKTGALTINSTAPSSIGLAALGDIGGGYFTTPDNLAQAWLAYTGNGIRAQGRRAVPRHLPEGTTPGHADGTLVVHAAVTAAVDPTRPPSGAGAR